MYIFFLFLVYIHVFVTWTDLLPLWPHAHVISTIYEKEKQIKTFVSGLRGAAARGHLHETPAGHGRPAAGRPRRASHGCSPRTWPQEPWPRPSEPWPSRSLAWPRGPWPGRARRHGHGLRESPPPVTVIALARALLPTAPPPSIQYSLLAFQGRRWRWPACLPAKAASVQAHV